MMPFYRDAATPADIRITHFLLDQGPADRAAICASCGLKWTSAFDVLKRLLAIGGVEKFIEPSPEAGRNRGRPHVLYRFRHPRPLLLEAVEGEQDAE